MSNQTTDKQRHPAYDIDPVFINRWSPRSFLEKKVPDDLLMSLFEAARWSPSAHNAQPWRFILARSEEDRNAFLSFILPGNRAWCEKAPVFALLLSKKTIDQKENHCHTFDAGTAYGYLALEATQKGLITHAIGGFEQEKARQLLHVPKDYDLHIVIAIGYQGEKAVLPEELQEREQPSARRPVVESVYEGSFGQELK